MEQAEYTYQWRVNGIVVPETSDTLRKPNKNRLLLKMVKEEIQNSWWAGYLSNKWLQGLAADYYIWKCKRKLKNRTFKAMIQDA